MALKKTVTAQNGMVVIDAYIVARPSLVNDAVSGKEIQIDFDIRQPNPKAGQLNEPNYLFYPFLPATRVKDKAIYESYASINTAFTSEQRAIYQVEQYAISHIPELAGAVQV